MSDSLSNAPVESWDVSKLVEYENNNKKHPASQVAELARSIAESGLENPILIEEDGTIISGHGRYLAVLSLDWTKVPVRVARGMDKTQARKLRIAVNKVTGQDYDTDALMLELKDLQDLDISLEGMGLSEKEMEVLLEDVGRIDLGTLSDEITEEVARHEEGVERTAREAEESSMPISKPFGTKQVTNGEARLITRFIGVAEGQTGEEGFAAVVSFMRKVVEDAS